MSDAPSTAPVASLLDCSTDGASPGNALVSLGLAGGELVTVQLAISDLSKLAAGVLQVLVALGFAPATLPHRMLHERLQQVARFSGGASSLMPPSELPQERKKMRQPKPFSQATKHALKVRFDGEPSHRRLAIVAGWRVSLQAYRPKSAHPVRTVLLVRWRVLVKGQGSYRDFLVMLPAPDEDPKRILYLGDHIEGMRLHREQLLLLNAAGLREEVTLGELRLRRLHITDILEQTRYVTYRAGCPADKWDRDL